MQLYNSIPSNFPYQPLFLSIGNFDGIHRGHQKLFRALKAQAKQVEGSTALISFSNHPVQVLNPKYQPSFLFDPLEHKPLLIEQQGIDHLFLLEFTLKFSQMETYEFLQWIFDSLGFEKLILGYDARLGKNREGDPATVKAVAKKLGFDVEYIAAEMEEGEPISSSQIRKLLHLGNLETIEKLLGRPYSIYGKGIQEDKTIRFNLPHLCLPPAGIYRIEIDHVPCTAKVTGSEITVDLTKRMILPERVEVNFSSLLLTRS